MPTVLPTFPSLSPKIGKLADALSLFRGYYHGGDRRHQAFNTIAFAIGALIWPAHFAINQLDAVVLTIVGPYTILAMS